MTTPVETRPHLADLLRRVPALAGRCRMHPRADAAGREVLRWAEGAGLTGTPAALRRLRAISSHRMAGRVFTDSADGKLVLFAQWLAWVVLLDDGWDDRSRPTPRQIDHTYDRLLQVVDDDRAPVRADPMEAAFAWLWQVTAAGMGPAWRGRFRAHLEFNRASTHWEARTRHTGEFSPLAEYPRHRRVASASFIFDAGEAVLGTELDPVLMARPAWSELADAANDVSTWVNDVLTLDKDEREADLSNYVLAARHHLGLSTAAAVSWVIDRIAERERDLYRAARALPETYRRLGLSHGAARAASKVACAYLALPHANVEWICEAPRYRPAA
ncbi:terpene synthase family protein [Nonomuraea sp. NPDC004297]